MGGGASAVKDGLDYAAAMWNPEGDMADVEIWEILEPLLYLGRRIKPNTAGPGKYRGGSGFESLRPVAAPTPSIRGTEAGRAEGHQVRLWLRIRRLPG